MTNKQKQEKRIKGINSMIAGITGAALGFGIAVAGAIMVLGDKNKGKKLKDSLVNAKDQTLGYIASMKKQTQEGESEIEKFIQTVGKAKKEGEKYGSN